MGEKFGNCHASTDKVFWDIQQFSVPKGSPLYVSNTNIRYPTFIVNFKRSILSMHQRDFNTAISWWIATGIWKKMEHDVRSKFIANSFWIPQLMQEETPLEMYHVAAQFMLVIFGLFLSILSFLVELLLKLHRNNQFKEVRVTKTNHRKKEMNKNIEIVPVSS